MKLNTVAFTGHETATTVTDDTVTYHSTVVACLVAHPETGAPNSRIKLRSGGRETVTTKRRINQAFAWWGLPYQLYQKAGCWFIRDTSNTDGAPWPFHDGMTLPV